MKEFVTIVGGVNVDIIGFPLSNLVPQDSNPGQVKMSSGGVGRNIAENLVKLGVPTKLISAIGNDIYGQQILVEAQRAGLDMQDSLILKGHSTSTYLAVLDEKRDMHVAISAMDILAKLSIDFIKQKRHIIDNVKVCVIDTNIPKDVIEYILTHYNQTYFFLDTVSTVKAMKVKDFIGKFHTIKPNKIEAEILSGLKINNIADLEACGEYFLRQGVKRVFITLGEDGLYYTDGANKGHLPAHKIKVVNATGAGDAFMAGLVYCSIKGFDIDYCARFATSASALALSHENTINPNMSVENVTRLMEGLIC
ncbi:MAG: PfkB family carbohydrate kinase [Desulfitobacteriaceae bacterium]|nr:PfkB family carbohydrate kinase [Desulfitobacteriaceae bacterium]